MSTIKPSYANAASITCTLASLATSSARECTAVDNTSNLYQDALLYLALKLQTGTPGSEKAIYVWFYAGDASSNYTDNATGSDAAVTMRSPSNLLGPFTIATPDAGGLTYKAQINVAQFFGGVLPPKWGFVIQNMTNVTFSATGSDHTKQYQGINPTLV